MLPLFQHRDEHGPDEPVLLGMDQQLRQSGSSPKPEITDCRTALEVGQHEDVKQLRAELGASLKSHNVGAESLGVRPSEVG
jgi:hypothetical protein